MSIISTNTDGGTKSDKIATVGSQNGTRKVLEEDEYLDRMASIIKRDFFPETNTSNQWQQTPSTSERLASETPGTNRTGVSTTSSTRSRKAACSLRLNEFLDRYTNEDNHYFEQLQQKDKQSHRARFPWLYEGHDQHNKRVRDQLELPGTSKQTPETLETSRNNATRTIDWPYNQKNSLFHPPQSKQPQSHQSTVNYRSSRYMRKPIFKEPLPVSSLETRPKLFNRFADKIGIDGRLLNEAETPSINGYSFVPEPETPVPVVDRVRVKTEPNRFYIPNESPRDNLAHRVYQEKVAKNIRTPRTGTRSRTPRKS